MTTSDDTAAPGAPSNPDLLSGMALVALVPATDDLDRAAALAWGFARRTALAGRRVALVDCFVDEPQLHAAAGDDNREGIVDVFEYGCSLSRIARQQPEEDLFFVPAGTFEPDPTAMMAHPRWRRLAAGFRHQDAVMLLFLPAECIASMGANLDGLVALAPDGAEVGLATTPEIDAAADLGVPLLATLTDADEAESVAVIAEPASESAPWAPPLPASSPEPDTAAKPVESVAEERESLVPAIRRPRRDGPLRWRARIAVYAPLAVLAAAVMVVSYRRELGLGDLGLRNPVSGADRQPEPPMSVVPTYRTLVPHDVDSLPFAVQVSAWTSLAFALDASDALEGRGIPPVVVPIRLGQQVWYRVYAGPVPTEDAADSLLDAVRAAGFDRGLTAGTALVPLSLGLRRVAGPMVARSERARLRAVGIPAFVLGQADGSYRLYAGAYAEPAQAAYFDSLLTSTGNAGQLGPRVGYRP
jgi:hypothetical protein